MSQRHAKSGSSSCPPTRDDLQQQLHHQLDQIICFCLSDSAPTSFFDFEKTLLARLRSLGCLLIQLFLRARHDRLDLTTWTKTRGYRLSFGAAPRTLKTTCGPVTSFRSFLVPRRGGYRLEAFLPAAAWAQRWIWEKYGSLRQASGVAGSTWMATSRKSSSNATTSLDRDGFQRLSRSARSG